MKLGDLDNHLKKLLFLDEYERADISLNGLQVGDHNREIKRVAVAVDACQETIERAAQLNADMLFVHHGFFWGRPIAITQNHYRRIESLLNNQVALYAVHLPLDAHPELGNNAQLAERLQLKSTAPFGEYKGKKIGIKGELPAPLSIAEVIRQLGTTESDCLSILPFGQAEISTVGIVSGGAPREVMDAIDEGLDLFVTGDASHEIYHLCLESQINVISAGHYFTETVGVQAVARYLEEKLGLETVFIDLPTGL